MTFGAAATALGAGGFISCPTRRPERTEIRDRGGECVQVWSGEGAATRKGLQPSGVGASTRPVFLRRLGTGAAPTEATGAAGNRPRPPMQYSSLTLGGEALVGGSSVAKELQTAERLRRKSRDPDREREHHMRPRSGPRDLEEGFPPWFPTSCFDETTEAEFSRLTACQGLGSRRRRGTRGSRSRGWSGRRDRDNSSTSTSTGDGSG